MNNLECCATATAKATNAERLGSWVKRHVGRLALWLYLNIWCRHGYRHVMRLLHRFNLHYAPPSPMSPIYGQRDHWCQWCGLRGHTWKLDPNAPLHSPNGGSLH
jgi:hypothetical protein